MSTRQIDDATDSSIRLHDYLNDRIQTFADLENINELLAQVHEHQELLRQQLLDAQRSSQGAGIDYQEHASTLENRGQAFEGEQRELEGRIRTITQSNRSDDAVGKFEARMNKVRRLEIARGYLETLRVVDALRTDAQKNVETNPRTSVAAYTKLQSISTALLAAQPAAEGAAPHLVDQVGQDADELHQALQTRVEERLRRTLDRMNWPNKELKLIDSVVNEWNEQAEVLLQLQESVLLMQADRSEKPLDESMIFSPIQGTANKRGDTVVLSPLQVMAEPLELRFRFHFYGDKPTNRIDKPEFFLSHIFDLLDQHGGILVDLLQHILDQRQSFHDETLYTDPLSSFIASLLPMVEKKCLSVLPQVVKQPQLLSHFVHELMSFDQTLRNDWAYHPDPDPLSEWKGMTWTMLTTHNYFEAWLNAERDFALNRYNIIEHAPDSADIDFDSAGPASTKTTKGAIRVTDLFEQITDRYRTLTSFSQKMKFLIDIQLSIIDNYRNFLHGAMHLYAASTHTAGRLMQGESAKEALGMKGMQSVTKIYGSCEYFVKKMIDWSDDVFFLELWAELEDRASRDRTVNATVGRDLNVHEVAAKTSRSIKNDEVDGGGLFDEAAAAYRSLRDRSEEAINSAMVKHVHDSISPYTEIKVWATLSPTGTGTSAGSHSSELDSLLQMLSAYLEFLASGLGPAPLRKVTTTVCQAIQKEIYSFVLLRQNFSAAGAMQLNQDVAAICSTIDASIKTSGEARRNIRKLGDALVLLGLGLKSSGKTAADDEEDGWEFDENMATVTDGQDAIPDEGRPYGLWEAERLISKSEESARKVLADLGLEHLYVAEARNIIARRVEISS